MKHPLDSIMGMLEISADEANRQAMRDILKDKLAYMEDLIEQNKTMEELQ